MSMFLAFGSSMKSTAFCYISFCALPSAQLLRAGLCWT